MSSNILTFTPPRHEPEVTIRDQLRHVLDMLGDAVCIVDADGHFVYASTACEQIFGYKPGEMIGRQMLEMIHPDDRASTLHAVGEVMRGLPNHHFENRYFRKDGSVVHVMWSARWSPRDNVRIAVARDITEQKRAAAVQKALLAISEAAHTATDLLDMFRQIHAIVGGLLPARNCFVALHDTDTNTLNFPYFVDEHDDPPAPIPFDCGAYSAEVIRSSQALLLKGDGEVFLPSAVGHESLDWLGVPLIGQKGVIGALVVQSYSGETRYTEQDKELLGFVSAQIAAAIERKQSETWLRYIAQHDTLTNLANRKLFNVRLQAALARVIHEQGMLALLYLDVDCFKSVNDTLGHEAGDRLLNEAAQRISCCVRETDTVGRMGGDEFVVLLTGITHASQARIVTEKILTALRCPFELPEGPIAVGVSIGIATCPAHGTDAQQLMHEADKNMYAAKKAGGNRYWMSG